MSSDPSERATMEQAMICLQAVFQENTGQKQPETGCKLSTSEYFLWVQPCLRSRSFRAVGPLTTDKNRRLK